MGAMVEKGSGHGPDFFTIDVSLGRGAGGRSPTVVVVVDVVLLSTGRRR